ncbi:MAG: autotransporter domain-containing protein, partial [Azoarcus sp.]|nr:autotransporter domain-containing protein [Azoarcus sp.]
MLADLAAGKLVFGVFVEYGSADFDTRNSLPGRKIKGGGDTTYLGGGLLLRFDQAGGPGGHVYGEASLRAGKAETDFSSRDLNTGFDTTSGYFGLHLGTGYLWRMSDSANLDLYVKYLWSHQEGDKVTLSSGDPVAFGDVDSHRARLGARLA